MISHQTGDTIDHAERSIEGSRSMEGDILTVTQRTSNATIPRKHFPSKSRETSEAPVKPSGHPSYHSINTLENCVTTDNGLNVADALTEADRLLTPLRRSSYTFISSRRSSRRASRRCSVESSKSALDLSHHSIHRLFRVEDGGNRNEEKKGPGIEHVNLRSTKVRRKMRYLTCIAAIGGFLSGYNTGVISGAMLPLKRVFSLTDRDQEAIVSATIVSAFLSSLLGETINSKFGRRLTIMSAALIFTGGALLIFFASTYIHVIGGEILLGIGIGIESLTSPMYIAEVASPSTRGMLVSMYGLLMCFGQFFAGIVDGFFGKVIGGWRFMFGVASIPGIVMFHGFLNLPESPSWLIAAGEHEEAKRVLHTIRETDGDVMKEMIEIEDSLVYAGGQNAGEDKNDTYMHRALSMVRHPPTRRALIVGCGLMVLQQVCGPNVVMYYAATIYRMTGYDEITSIWLSAFTAFAQIIGLFFSVCLVEKAGRRILVLASLSLVALALLGLGQSFYLARISSSIIDADNPLMDEECKRQPSLVWSGVTLFCYDCVQIDGCGYCGGVCVRGDIFGPYDSCPENSSWIYDACENPYGWYSALSMITYLLVFGIGMAGLPWAVNSEIYPLQHRSLAVSISTSTNWIWNLLISSSFLTISNASVLTTYGAFWLYAAMSLAGVVWMYFSLPETKGLSIEEIEEKFRKPGDLFDQSGKMTQSAILDADFEKLLVDGSAVDYSKKRTASESYSESWTLGQ